MLTLSLITSLLIGGFILALLTQTSWAKIYAPWLTGTFFHILLGLLVGLGLLGLGWMVAESVTTYFE